MIARPGQALLKLAAFVCVVGFAALGCSRGTIPILVGGDLLPSTLTAAAGVTRTPLYLFTPGPGFQFPHAVFGIPEGETLVIRQVAGVSGGAVGSLEFGQRGLALTGTTTSLGSSTWVEIRRPSGGTGWVPALSLTQDVPPEAFCSDSRIEPLLAALRRTIADRDGVGLQAIVSPRRGLAIRYDWWNPEVIFRPGDVATLFQANTEYDWGTQLSGGAIRGTAADVVVPRLDRIAAGEVVFACNETRIGPALREARWPSEYSNLNYSALFFPSQPGESEYAWTTWLVGIEYVDNQPYISRLVQLRAGI
ncbi:MAG TPA: SH3 domain-containing protein [Anaerolineales bacterium]|nr:SH3 domain-containing protein [Anaerolineales bacterium]